MKALVKLLFMVIRTPSRAFLLMTKELFPVCVLSIFTFILSIARWSALFEIIGSVGLAQIFTVTRKTIIFNCVNDSNIPI